MNLVFSLFNPDSVVYGLVIKPAVHINQTLPPCISLHVTVEIMAYVATSCTQKTAVGVN